jgi:CRP/FNR family transcriptional regulator, cyclic AMP receptor protein
MQNARQPASKLLHSLDLGWLGREPDDFRAYLHQQIRLKVVPAGQSIYASDDQADALMGVATGQIALRTPLISGEEVVGHICLPGFWLGATMLASHDRRRYLAAFARTDATVAVVPLSLVRRTLQDQPQWWPSFARLSEVYWNLTACIVADLMLRRHDDRVIATLLRAVGLRPRPATPAPDLRVAITHQEIAIMANCSQSFVHGELRRLQDKGWVELAYGNVRLLAPDAMLARLVR